MKVNTFVVASKLLLLNTSLLLGVEGKRESPFASVLTVRQGKQQDTIAGLSLTRTLADSETKGDPMAQRKLNTNALDTLHEVWTAASTTSASVQSSCEKSKSKASKAPTGSKGPKATKGPKKSKGRKSSKAPSVKGSHKGRCTAPAPTAPGTVTAPTPGTTVSTPTAGSTPSLNTARCAAVAGETLVTSLTGTTFDVNLGMVIASSVVTAGMTENAIDATRNGFQSGTAPGLTTCGDDRRRGRSRLLADTTVENVVFGDIDSTGFVDCMDLTGSDSAFLTCLRAAGLVTAYHDGDLPSDFAQQLKDAILAADLPTDQGVIKIETVDVTPSSSPAVSEGAGSAVVTGNQRPQENIQPDDGKLSAGAAVGIAFAVLAVVLGAIFIVRRRHQQARSEGLKPVFTIDDEDDNDALIKDEHPDRKVHVLGEEDSLLPGQDIEVMSVMKTEAEERHEYCSSPSCDICERRRQSGGVNFVGTATALPAGVPHDASRTYIADDTITL